MKYHKEQIVKCSIAVAVYSLLALALLALLLGNLRQPGEKTAYIIVMLLMLGYNGFGIWVNLSSLLKNKKHYDEVSSSGLLQSLRSIDPYPTEEARQYAFAREQQQRKIYTDPHFCMTEHFLSSTKGLLLISGILDAHITVRRRNGVIERLVLDILYYTGEKPTLVYTRPFGFSGGQKMKEQLANLEFAVNVMASKSPIFRKYENCRLT